MIAIATPICPRCGRETAEAQAAFCPFCGARLTAAEPVHTPPGAAALLQRAADQSSNRKKLALLRQAREEYPDCLAVEEELLFQGRLPEKAGFTPDFSCIKSYLLHMYLTPEEFAADQQDAMRRELFGDPQLLRCLALAPSEEAYTAHYLERLSSEFIQIFLFGSNEYMPRLLGFQLERRPEKALARPAAQVLRGIRADEGLSPRQRAALEAAFERAFAAQVGGNLTWLKQALEE